MLFKKNIKIPVEVSARHCHLSKESLEKLFGQGYELKKMKQLSQPSDFACEETVSLKFGSKTFDEVRIVGPLRDHTQAEISFTDAVGSGLMPEVRLSGDIKGTAGFTLSGPAGEAELGEGLIVAQRHMHCGIAEAKKLKLKTGDVISVKMDGPRSLVFNNVKVRVGENYKLSMHVDTDEGNAAGINKMSQGIIIK